MRRIARLALDCRAQVFVFALSVASLVLALRQRQEIQREAEAMSQPMRRMGSSTNLLLRSEDFDDWAGLFGVMCERVADGGVVLSWMERPMPALGRDAGSDDKWRGRRVAVTDCDWETAGIVIRASARLVAPCR